MSGDEGNECLACGCPTSCPEGVVERLTAERDALAAQIAALPALGGAR